MCRALNASLYSSSRNLGVPQNATPNLARPASSGHDLCGNFRTHEPANKTVSAHHSTHENIHERCLHVRSVQETAQQQHNTLCTAWKTHVTSAVVVARTTSHKQLNTHKCFECGTAGPRTSTAACPIAALSSAGPTCRGTSRARWGSAWILRRFAMLPLGSSSKSAAAGVAGAAGAPRAAQGVLVWAMSSCVSGRAMVSPGRHQPGRCKRTPCGSSW